MTDLLYLNDFDVTTCQAVVESIGSTDDGRTAATLDQTCFYPRGGGQDWDYGTIVSDDIVFNVEEVRLDSDGTVQHIGKFANGRFMAGEDVDCKVDEQRRWVNTRLHSAGHLVDMAIDALGLDWVAVKAQHYIDLSAIEYNGKWDESKAEELRSAIEQKSNELIATKTDNKIEFMPVDQMHTVCRHVPANIPTNKPSRVVIYGENFGIPCGGTHVRNLADVGEIQISKIKCKKGVIRVNYEVVGINDK